MNGDLRQAEVTRVGIIRGMAERATSARPRPLTVRGRIVGVVVAVAAVGILVSGFAAYAVERERVLAAVEERLLAGVENVRFVVTDGTWTGLDEALAAVVQQVNPDDNAGSLGIIDGNAAFVPGMPVDVPLDRYPDLVPRVVAETAGERVVTGTYAGDGVALRYIATPVRLAGDPAEGVFVNAYDIRGELSEIDGAASTFLIAAAVAVGVTAIVGWLVASRLLRPLRELRATAERITATASAERIPVRGNDDVSELTRTVNDMLDRLDGAIEGQRRLLDDVGHELKTPITIVRGHLELLDPADPIEVEAARALAIDELDRMSALVGEITDMVKLGTAPVLQRTETDLGALTSSIISKARAIIGADEVRAGPIAEGVAELDAARVTQAVLQLAQNAVTHGGGRFVIGSHVESPAAEVRFTVADQGPGVPEDQRSRIFERFGRVEQGRGRSGSGLGLAIVTAIATAHGGRVELASSPGFGAAFSLVLPLGATAVADRSAAGAPGENADARHEETTI